MTMRAPIVVGTDFRARADRAIDRALQLGQDHGAEVIAVHAFDPDDEDAPGEAELQARLRAVLPHPDAPVSFHIRAGEANEAIGALAREAGASLIVLGVARYNEVKDYFLGTAVDRIIREAPVPVLVVKNRSQGPYRRVVAATDFHLPSRIALERAADLFPDRMLEAVHAFHVPFEGWQKAEYVREDTRQAEQRVFDEFLQELRPETRARVTPRLLYGNPQAAVLSALEDPWRDLVVIGTQGESGLRHATIGSTASELLRTVPADTLVVTAPTAG